MILIWTFILAHVSGTKRFLPLLKTAEVPNSRGKRWSWWKHLQVKKWRCTFVGGLIFFWFQIPDIGFLWKNFFVCFSLAPLCASFLAWKAVERSDRWLCLATVRGLSSKATSFTLAGEVFIWDKFFRASSFKRNTRLTRASSFKRNTRLTVDGQNPEPVDR